jgi:hypothetical protein
MADSKNATGNMDGRAFSWRAVLIGAVIVGVISYLCPIVEQYEWEIDYTIPAPPVSVMFFFFLVVVVNALLFKFSHRLALDSNELLLIYAMTMVGAPLCSFGLVQFLIPNMVGPIHFATPENMWQEDFLHHVPDWFGPRDKGVIDGFYTGTWDGVPWSAWIKPLLIWHVFALVLYFVLLCICAIIRKQWVERERLTFRILETPLVMAEEPESGRALNSFFRNKMTWIGFSIPILVQISVGLHHHFPGFPSLKIMHIRLEDFFTDKPWNAVGYFHISVMYSIIGIAYMVPANVSLSCWFFYLIGKAENVFAAAVGWRGGETGGVLTRFPDLNDQAVGAFFALFFLSLWMMRRHLWEVLKGAFKRSRVTSSDAGREAMSYSFAVFGFILGTAFLVFWTWVAGLSPVWAFVFFGVFFIFQTVLSRIRAESGMAWLFLPETPNNVIVLFTGTVKLGIQNLTVLSSLKFHTFDQNGYIMPSQLEALKIPDVYKVKGRHLTLAILMGIVLYIGISSWSSLNVYYKYGANICGQWRVESGKWAFDELERWVSSPSSASPSALFFMGVGALFYFFLAFMRLRYLWWPFHPIGYAVANTFTMQYLWSPFFFGWLAKVIVLKAGGIKSYRHYVPFFLGLIMGEAVGNGFWVTFLGEIFGVHGFAYFEF